MSVGQVTHLPPPARFLVHLLPLHPPVHPTPPPPLHPAPHPHRLILLIQTRNRKKGARRKRSTTTRVTRKRTRGRKRGRKKGSMANREVSVGREEGNKAAPLMCVRQADITESVCLCVSLSVYLSKCLSVCLSMYKVYFTKCTSWWIYYLGPSNYSVPM